MLRRSHINRFFGSLFGGAASKSSSSSPVSASPSSASGTSTSAADSSDQQQTSQTLATKKYATGIDALKDESSWTLQSPQHQQQQQQQPIARANELRRAHAAVSSSSSLSGGRSTKNNNNSDDTQQEEQEQEGERESKSKKRSSEVVGTTPSSSSPPVAVGWMAGAEWASIGEEFKGIEPSKFLKPSPDGFLTRRAMTDIQPAEALMQDFLAITAETYKGVDVRDPSSMTKIEGEKPRWLTMGGQVRAVSEFISGHLAHQVSLPVWMDIFDLKYMEGDVMYWLWVLHLHIVARRATSVRIDTWSRRREVLEELVLTMFQSWNHTSEEIMGRPPLSRIRQYIKDMYFVTAINLEEALMHDGPGGDLMLVGVLVKFCPLPRPEDIPLYTYYTLVHYLRFHIALFDRLSDEEFSRGNFNFFSPDDPAVFKKYGDIEMDEVIRAWKVGAAPDTEAAGGAAEQHDAAAGSSAQKEGASRN